jgi:general stress protein YciG
MNKQNARETTNRASDEHAENRTADSRKSQASSGRGWHGDSQGHAAAGSKGGQKVSQNREHMARIGRKGGQTVSRDRQHMAEIGRKGGQSRSEGGADQSEQKDRSQ